jgi:hypothetical protein
VATELIDFLLRLNLFVRSEHLALEQKSYHVPTIPILPYAMERVSGKPPLL